jgi:exonuclease III
MHIITWNLAFTNPRVIKSLEFLLSKDPDVVCLQEVKKEGLEFLKKQKQYQLFSIIDGDNANPKFTQNLVLMVKNKYKVENMQTYNYFGGKHNSLWDFMIKKVIKYEKNHEGMFVDLTVDNVPIRIFTFHLKWSCGPSIRFNEFEKILALKSLDRENIFAGDFNIFSNAFYTPLGSLVFNYKKSDLFINERERFEKIFNDNNLINIFRGENTWPWIGLKFQLDHILFNPKIKYYDKKVPKQKVGSDHKMIEVKLDFKNYQKL